MLFRKKTYQISLTAIAFACGSLFTAGAVLAQAPLEDPNAGNLVVEFSSTPLFSENDFLPGDSAFGYAIVSNNSGNPKPIAIEAINIVNDDLDTGGKFGDGLNLIIKEDLSYAECFNGTLTEFFDKGEFLLSAPDLLNSEDSITYNFVVTFNESSGDDYQGKNLGFDIIIGFQRGESISDGDGGGLPSGLIIKNVRVYDITSTSAKFSWFTSYNATSRVIYCESSNDCVLNLSDTNDMDDTDEDPALYGFQLTTPEYHTPVKDKGVMYRGEGFNEIEIMGLTPGTTYYFRCISHASPPTISRSHSFMTLAMGDGDNDDTNGSTQENGANDADDDGDDTNGFTQASSPWVEVGANDAGDGASGEEAGLIPNISKVVNSVGNFISSALGGANKTKEDIVNSNKEWGSKIESSSERSIEQILLFVTLLFLAFIILLYCVYQLGRRKDKEQKV